MSWLFVIQFNKYDKNFEISLENWKVKDLSPEECLEKGGRTLNIVGGDICEKDEVNIGKVVGFISPNICCL
ncbi:unnamed protein product [marine sediment metagenome]|uniref:Uncharacterized protein n=1 Tax=marine sediment metagenome TaxID=412755 RepID=X0TY61_9ZZZZ